MKTSRLFTAIAILSLFAFTACSDCYDCQQEVEIEVVQPDGSVITETETASEELCTASGTEVDDKEALGFTCSRQ